MRKRIALDQTAKNGIVEELLGFASASADGVVSHRFAFAIASIAAGRQPRSPTIRVGLGNRFQTAIFAEVNDQAIAALLERLQSRSLHPTTFADEQVEKLAELHPLGFGFGQT
ncbi:hypothetical protein [Crateriforma conspicua]|uniref:hypothetical protein n=1 Tax=Crateriforma conspicua TaxID=2527996 RepID=UPI0018CE2879|nr:hypothetical protein [Crateriforma conspicua]